MKDKIQKSLKGILSNLYNSPEIDINQYKVNIQNNKDKEHGDLASNIALILFSLLTRLLLFLSLILLLLLLLLVKAPA